MEVPPSLVLREAPKPIATRETEEIKLPPRKSTDHATKLPQNKTRYSSGKTKHAKTQKEMTIRFEQKETDTKCPQRKHNVRSSERKKGNTARREGKDNVRS